MEKGSDYMENKEKIKCFCGETFEFDWTKIPNTGKILYLRCPSCNAELKIGNPNYKDNK